jgi:hypothetical protein
VAVLVAAVLAVRVAVLAGTDALAALEPPADPAEASSKRPTMRVAQRADPV